METLSTAMGVESQCVHFAWRRHVNLMFDAHSTSMAKWAERAAVEVYIWYTEVIVSFMGGERLTEVSMEMRGI